MNKKLYIKILYIFILLQFTISHSFAEQKSFNSKIAVVDVESILEHSLAIHHIKKTILKISDQIQQDFTEKEIELKSIEHDLIKRKNSINEQEFNLEVTEFNKKVSNVQQQMQYKKINLEQSHAKAMSIVHNKTIDIIGKLLTKYGFDIALPSTQVLFVKNDLNITLEVISELNQILPEVDVKYSE